MTTADSEPFPPAGVDLSQPSVARIYDYFLGGDTNWEIDRQFAEQLLGKFPILRPIARSNRLFLHRLVRHLTKLGIRQFVDLGSGVPTMGHAHEVADQVAPGEVRVAYVDHEPVAVAHSRSLLRQYGDEDRHTAIHGDLRDPGRLWERIAETGVIDLDRPVALLMIAVLHIQQLPSPDSPESADLGPRLVATYRDLLAPGSYLGISHVTSEGIPDEFAGMLENIKTMYDGAGNPVIWRTRQQIRELFGDFRMIEPGLTWTPLWHPEEATVTDETPDLGEASEAIVLAGAAKKE
ncbi:methyltransferase [Amycolatopsis balhimycina DSM 5908]|uniref:Methyltransferase n=1 Tax=Amycolatopsis balhimycina DSM 5908 TaxID=1081091 RepID=A0A428WCU4_AMYBA|nr:SAM-dependent methyltransferase [Amycolatopsis balhimycina]RSM40886.1 methyltransferase [Amycolatopsis balhimycina DSM 5908]